MNTSPLPFTLPYALLFWAVYVWAFHWSELAVAYAASAKAAQRDAAPQDSFRWVKWVWFGALLSAFVAACWAPAQMEPAAVRPLFWTGLSLVLAGSVLRRHCIGLLGRDFTLEVRARATQTVVDRGAYAWVRHPAYSAGIVMLVGVGLALGSWASLVILATMAAVLYSRRIMFEERAMNQALGETYMAYARTRKRLVPYLC
jgi:protein-S-isoprenylcysteine O-methyltransferase Ste14